MEHHLTIPMLIIRAKKDKVFSEKEVEDTIQKYNAELKLFDNIAHDMMLDINQEKVSKAIINWIERKPAKNSVSYEKH